MITGAVFGEDIVIRRLQSRGAALQERLQRLVLRLAIKLQKHVKNDKLSGQVLHNRTGTLRRSISYKVENTPVGTYGIVGTNIVYAPPHEYGFHGAQRVKTHMRTIKQAFGRAINTHVIQVKAHFRYVDLPERSFLRSALEDMRVEIKGELTKEVNSTLQAR